MPLQDRIQTPEKLKQVKEEDLFSYIEDSNVERDLMHIREHGFKKGIGIGYPDTLDKVFVYKPQHFVLFIGHDNVGKTYTVMNMLAALALRYGQTWMVYLAEDDTLKWYRRLISWFNQKDYFRLTDTEMANGFSFAKKHFVFLRNDCLYDMELIFRICEKYVSEVQQLNGFLLDPYNALLEKDSGSHNYHYNNARQINVMKRQLNMSFWVNAHCVTESLRRTYKERQRIIKQGGSDYDMFGYPMVPHKADVEGGGKWPNKADDLIVLHRHVGHAALGSYTEWHQRKVKEWETGGKPTPLDEPIYLRFTDFHTGLIDYTHCNPLRRNTGSINASNNEENDWDAMLEDNIDDPF
jgi:hypothetical protein